MNKKLTKGFYSSPLVKIKEMQARQMLCQSGGINNMNRDDDQSLDW